jgi:hypothetical protein
VAVHVIVCGTIRTELEAYLVFQDLIAGRACGAIDRIVYCTWPDQIERARRFIGHLAEAGIEILATPLRQPSQFNVQVLPFYTALGLFDDEDIVARVRTDKCFPLVRTLIRESDALAAKSRSIGTDSIFKSRIVVSALSWNELFAHGDFFMLACAGDLRKICHMDSYFDVFCADVGAEARWFSRPYIQNYPDLRAVFETVSLLQLSKAIVRWAGSQPNDDDMAALPAGLGRVIGQYIHLCARDFALVNDNPEHAGLTLLDAYAARDPTRWQWGPRVFATSHAWVRRIGAGEGLGALGIHVQWAASADLHQRSVTAADLDEIRAFVTQHTREIARQPWPGLPIDIAKSNPDLATAYGWGSFRSLLVNLANIVDPEFDPDLVTDEMVALGARLADYPAQTYGGFCNICRETGEAIYALLQGQYGDDIPHQALMLPAVFFACSLTFQWDGDSGEWLADQLLADRLNHHFAPVTRWGLSARLWIQKPQAVYKAAELALRGIGGPVDVDEARRLSDHAAAMSQR